MKSSKVNKAWSFVVKSEEQTIIDYQHLLTDLINAKVGMLELNKFRNIIKEEQDHLNTAKQYTSIGG